MNKMFKYFFLVAIIFTLNTSLSIAQILHTERLNTSNGLSNNQVHYIFQDSYGLIWIGTAYGLNLYDGYDFKIFRNDPGDPQSINSSVIWWIVEDAEHDLWIATGEGVSKYLRAENKFKNYDFYGDYYSSAVTYIDLKGNLLATIETENILKYNKLNDSWDKPKFTLIDSSKKYTNPAHVLDITEDINKKLWIASLRYGLMWYDEKENVFRESEIMFEDNEADFASPENMINSLYSDSSGVLWIVTNTGIYKYNPNLKEFKTIEKYAKLGVLDDYGSITKDDRGNIWIANSFNGLLKFEGISDNFKKIKISAQNYSKDGESDLILTHILYDRTGILWIGSKNKGVFKYDPNKKIFKHYAHDENNNNSISHSYIYSVLESNAHPGKIYVGTRGGGLNIFDTQTNNFSRIPIRFFKDQYGGSVRSMLEEEDGSLWLGTWGDGLLKMDPQRKVVKRFYPDSANINGLSNAFVRIIRKDLSGNLWIGTYGGGLNYLDLQTNNFSRLNREFIIYPKGLIDNLKIKISLNLDEAKIIEVGNFENLSTEFEVDKLRNYLIVTAGEGDNSDSLMWDYGWIEDSEDNVIWESEKYASTYYIGGALKNRIKIETLQLKPGKYSLKYKSDDSHSFGNWNAYPPAEPEFWGIRIFKIDNQAELEKIQAYLTEIEKKLFISGSDILNIHLSKNNVIWVGTRRHGLHKIIKTENKVKTYLFNNKNKAGSYLSIFDIYENNEEILWIATNRGLIEFDIVNETYTNFTDQDGLPTNSISSILPGESNEMWLSTINGISKMIKNGIGKPTFVNYGIEDGLGGGNFVTLAALKTNNGKYFFGGTHGLNEFDSQLSISNPPKLLLSDLKISNVSVTNVYEDLLIETSVMDLENLSLSYSQNDLSFEFAALHFSDPKKNKYAHKLEGYEDDWIYDNRRIATYTNLNPGEYTFKFKGSNSEGIWNETGKAISIIISPPWWQTWWAYSIYVLCFLGLVSGLRIFDLKRRKEKEDRRILELENERKTKELEEARALQLSMLPKELPKIPHLDIAVYMKTATEVGGDYYDFHVKKDGTLTLVIGDATGHGMNAGTMVTATKSLFQNLADSHDLKQMFQQINKSLYLMNLQPLFMSLIAMRIKNNTFEIINGGMPDLLIYEKKNNLVKELKSGGPPLGAFVDYIYTLDKSKISNEDVILLMSDGFAERFNENDEILNYDRCINFYKDVAFDSPSEIIDSLINKGDEWAGKKEQDDDITFIVLKHK